MKCMTINKTLFQQLKGILYLKSLYFQILKYKMEFANQASGSKEARIRGVSLQY